MSIDQLNIFKEFNLIAVILQRRSEFGSFFDLDLDLDFHCDFS